jgi:hypothetical protein
MADPTQRPAPFSLRRWSQRKLAAGRGDETRPDPGMRPDDTTADAAANRAVAASSTPGETAAGGAVPAVTAAARAGAGPGESAGPLPFAPLASLRRD